MLGKYFRMLAALKLGIFKYEASARTNVDLGGKQKQACQYRTNSTIELI